MARMMDTVTLAVSCSHCGGSHIKLDGSGDDDSQATCGTCGLSLGPWAEVKEQARAAMFDAMRDDFRELLVAASRPTPIALAGMEPRASA